MLQFVKAPSILGLRPSGVEFLADALLGYGLNALILPQAPLLEVENFNHLYSRQRDDSGMINAKALYDFSLRLKEAVTGVFFLERFPVVLGGDCSILLGIMPALKELGVYGLVTFDAHADFYLPSQSVTGEAADMDLAIVTGRGASLLTDIDGLGPYVEDVHVVHIGQRDEKETMLYGSAQLSQTEIVRYGLDDVRRQGAEAVAAMVLEDIGKMDARGFWLHLDTDVIHDSQNMAVDYRLPDGLMLSECEYLLSRLVSEGYVKGLSVSIYNPSLDQNGIAGKNLAAMLTNVLRGLEP